MDLKLFSFVSSQFVFHKLAAAVGMGVPLEKMPKVVLVLRETKQPINAIALDQSTGSNLTIPNLK